MTSIEEQLMDVLSFRTPGLGDQTYLLTHEGQGILIDPQRDIDRFLQTAQEQGIEMRLVLETHLHNDYLSGGEQAALRTGAELILPAAAAAAYKHRPAFHLEDIEAENFTVRPIHTPGHTPEHTSYLVIIDGKPQALFSGGSLLVGSVGRPDLLGMERAMSLGRLQYISANRLAKLPREVGLFPTHGAGSFCTATGAATYTSTIGAEVDSSPMLKITDQEEFAAALIEAPMPIPSFYKYMGPGNTMGVAPMPPVTVPTMSLDALAGQPEGTRIIDIRPRPEQAAGFVPGSELISLTDDFGSWTGWLGEYTAPIVLIANDTEAAEEAAVQLAQIGIDTVKGVVTDLSGATLDTFDVATVAQAATAATSGVQVLDVRMPNEVSADPLEGASVRFVATLARDGIPAELDASKEVLIVCGSGRRASIAAGILKRGGYSKVMVLNGAGAIELNEKIAKRAAAAV